MSYFDSSTLLATVANVDLKSTGQTSLFVVPDSNYLFITDIIVALTDATLVTITPTIGVGKSAAYTEWQSGVQLVGLDTVGEWVSLADSSNLPIRQSFSSGEEVKFDVRTGATATTMRATIYVFGYIV